MAALKIFILKSLIISFLALIIYVFSLDIEFEYDAWLVFLFTDWTAGLYFNKHSADNEWHQIIISLSNFPIVKLYFTS